MSGKEQCVICIDNSEWMRNGDFNPTRMSSQQDAANLLCGRKTQSNPETTLAILTMAGSSPSVQVALTTDLGKLLSSLSQVKISGQINFSTSIKVAQLALKRRSSEQSSNKRIVAFIGSPLQESKEELEKLGLRLKKNNIAVDIVSFGELENSEKLEAFINSVNNSDNSHLVIVPPGPHILADLLLTSPVLYAGATGTTVGGEAMGGGEGAGEFEFGFDPTLDPELAMALRLSMEEENRRQGRMRQDTGGAPATAQATASTTTATTATATAQDEDVEMDEDEALRQAIAMSLAESGEPSSAQATKQSGDDEDVEMDEDEALRMALEMSKGGNGGDEENIEDILQDDKYMEGLVGSLTKKKDEDKKDEQK